MDIYAKATEKKRTEQYRITLFEKLLRASPVPDILHQKSQQ